VNGDKYELMSGSPYNESKLSSDEEPLLILYTDRGKYAALIPKPEPVKTDAQGRGLPAEVDKGPKVSMSERFKRALTGAKGKIAAGLGKVGATLKRGSKILKSGQYAGEISIMGELVRLNESEVEPDDGSVSFRGNYFYNLEPEVDIQPFKAVFSKIFNIDNLYKKGSSQEDIPPPCDTQERELLIKGLVNRMEKLYGHIQNLRQEGDTKALRDSLEHYQRLYIFVNNLEQKARESRCADYNEDGSIAGFSKISAEMDDEIRILLRQFAFMILQAKRPIGEFSEYTEEAKEFIGNLREVASTMENADNMDAYLQLWREQATESGENIPEVIGEVLDTTNTQNGLLQVMLEDALKNLFTQIVSAVRLEYEALEGITTVDAEGKPLTILTDFGEFVEVLKAEQSDPRNKIQRLVAWVVDKNLVAWKNLKDNQGNKEKLRADLAKNLETIEKQKAELDAKAGELAASQGKIKELNENILTLEGSNTAAEQSITALKEQAQRDIESAKGELEKMRITLSDSQELQETLQGQMEAVNKRVGIAEAEAAAAKEATMAAEKAAVDAREEATATLARTQGTLDAKAKEREAQMAEKEREVVEKDAKIGEISKEAAATKAADEAEKLKLNEQLTRLNQELAAKQEAVEKAEIDVKKYTEFADKKVREVGDLKQKIKELEGSTGLDALRRNSEIADLGGKLQTAQRESEKLQADLSAKKALYESELGKLRDELAGERTAKQSAAATAAAALAAAVREKETLTAQASAAARSHDEAIKALGKNSEEELAKLTAGIDNLKVAKEAAEAESKKVAAAMAEIEGKLPALQEQLKAAQADKDGQEKGLQGVLGELTKVAESITKGSDYAVPTGLMPNASDALNALITNIGEMKKNTQGMSASNQICFLSYFITFFLKAMFFTRTNIQKLQAVMTKLEALASKVLIGVKPLFPELKEDKHVIYKIMEVIFGLLDAGESLFINKETRDGKEPGDTDIGLTVVIANGELKAKEVFKLIHDGFKPLKGDAVQQLGISVIKDTLFKDFFMSQPNMFFNTHLFSEKPLQIDVGVFESLSDDGRAILNNPSFTFLPNGTATEDDKMNFQMITMEKGYNKRRTNLDVSLQDNVTAQKRAWVAEMDVKLKDDTVSYTSLFCLFIIFGRQYLVAAEADLLANKCSLPAQLKNPASMIARVLKDQPAPPPPRCEPGKLAITVLNAETSIANEKRLIAKLNVEGAENATYSWNFVREGNALNPFGPPDQLFSDPTRNRTSLTLPNSAGKFNVTCKVKYTIGSNKQQCEDNATAPIEVTQPAAQKAAASSNSTRVADALSKKRAAEAEAQAQAQAAEAAKAPASRSRKPLLEPLKTTEETLYEIIRQVHLSTGAPLTQSITSTLPSSVPNTSMPILMFMHKYDPNTKVFVKSMFPSRVFEKEQDLKQRFSIVFRNIWANLPSANLPQGITRYSFLHAFIFDFFKAYVIQYNYKNAAQQDMAITDKIEMLFPVFLDFIGSIKLQKKDKRSCEWTIFDLLYITKEALRDYTLKYNPDKPDEVIPTKLVHEVNKAFGYPPLRIYHQCD
jgi:hypothetical protein